MRFEVPAEDKCPFCAYLSGSVPCAFVTRGPVVSVFMNRAQFERGAALVIPNAHVTSLLELDRVTMAAVFEESQRTAKAMVRALGAVGLNMFQNNGIKAGQTISHYHMHLVPRYPTSEGQRVFSALNYPHTPVAELAKIADELRAGFTEP